MRRSPLSPGGPTLTTTIRPRTEEIYKLVDFAEAHQQQVVTLDVEFEASNDPSAFQVNTDEELVSLFVGTAPFAECGSRCGAEIMIEDVGNVADSIVGQVGATGYLTGRFAVQSVSGPQQGIMSIRLRAVPITGPDVGALPPPSPSRTPSIQRTCEVLDGPFVAYPGRVLAAGDTDNDIRAVRWVQDFLNAEGYGCVGEDGYFGTTTKRAVMLFQKDSQLSVDGVVGPETWAMLAMFTEGDCGEDC
jgi:hypothetical protein